MGELKDVAENQTQVGLVDRVKDLGNQVYLAGLGLVTKVEEEGQKQLDKLQAAGQAARGEKAAADKKAVLVAFGLVETLKTEVESLKAESQKLFGDLVASGEKRKAV
ncbi:MAG: phasin family protein [Fluviicoccus sp.]|uniref:phasin family protein n=1 Tax=Fluviicoccus sp. TaxID=2003552 RepID=UPI002724BEED|nr:phasin family protein [Fluviicoccus sp.]MDO8331569.1 phasin family protein [Fluviicoccus sp.]